MAKVRRTWIQSLLINPCEQLNLGLCGGDVTCCTTQANIVLVDNETLQEKFSDEAKVVRILCDLLINIDPHLETITNPIEVYERLSACQGSAFVGLVKTLADGTGGNVLPPDIWAPTTFDTFSEGLWKKTWWHHWDPMDGFMVQLTGGGPTAVTYNASFPTVCADTHTTGAGDNDFADGTGTINIGTDCTTQCVECPQSVDLHSQLLAGTTSLKGPRPWRFHFDLKKRIFLRERESLSLMFQLRLNEVTQQTWTPAFTWDILGGGIKTLVQF